MFCGADSGKEYCVLPSRVRFFILHIHRYVHYCRYDWPASPAFIQTTPFHPNPAPLLFPIPSTAGETLSSLHPSLPSSLLYFFRSTSTARVCCDRPPTQSGRFHHSNKTSNILLTSARAPILSLLERSPMQFWWSLHSKSSVCRSIQRLTGTSCCCTCCRYCWRWVSRLRPWLFCLGCYVAWVASLPWLETSVDSLSLCRPSRWRL